MSLTIYTMIRTSWNLIYRFTRSYVKYSISSSFITKARWWEEFFGQGFFDTDLQYTLIGIGIRYLSES